MTDKQLTAILFAAAFAAFLILMGLVAHMDYVEARTGINCENHVRSCE